jgi:hypothetical protein
VYYFSEDEEVQSSTQSVNGENYIRKKPFKTCHVECQRMFSSVSFPSKAITCWIVNKFWITGCLSGKKLS